MRNFVHNSCKNLGRSLFVQESVITVEAVFAAERDPRRYSSSATGSLALSMGTSECPLGRLEKGFLKNNF